VEVDTSKNHIRAMCFCCCCCFLA